MKRQISLFPDNNANTPLIYSYHYNRLEVVEEIMNYISAHSSRQSLLIEKRKYFIISTTCTSNKVTLQFESEDPIDQIDKIRTVFKQQLKLPIIEIDNCSLLQWLERTSKYFQPMSQLVILDKTQEELFKIYENFGLFLVLSFLFGRANMSLSDVITNS